MPQESSSPSDSRFELRQLLHQQKQLMDRLLEQLDDPTVSSISIVEVFEAVERLDKRKAELSLAFREEVSTLRTREEERSVRQFVLRALGFLGCPQSARFLREFIWAHERIDLETRGFGALRRDEARAWRRRPGYRVAYIVPGLGPDGYALARWMARSDWPLERRIVVQNADRLFMLKALSGVFRAREETSYSSVSDPYFPVIERYATELNIGQQSSHSPSEEDWLSAVRTELEEEIETLEPLVVSEQGERARRLASTPVEHQLWGPK